MTVSRRIRVLLLIVAVLGWPGRSVIQAGQQAPAAAPGPRPDPKAALSIPLSAQVPVDPRITTGTLSNGLRYYIRANKSPRNRAELRLAVNAGSILEDDDQRGLAQMV